MVELDHALSATRGVWATSGGDDLHQRPSEAIGGERAFPTVGRHGGGANRTEAEMCGLQLEREPPHQLVVLFHLLQAARGSVQRVRRGAAVLNHGNALARLLGPRAPVAGGALAAEQLGRELGRLGCMLDACDEACPAVERNAAEEHERPGANVEHTRTRRHRLESAARHSLVQPIVRTVGPSNHRPYSHERASSP